jgi:hypothetical protein
VQRTRNEHLASLVRDEDRREIDLEDVRHRPRDGLERRLEREALRE